ncbi:MAG: amidohydrolase family protein [Alphaproteobacteria bacterium]|nr:amidohydrolase family protein [Alphaproteobacteria bacterium]
MTRLCPGPDYDTRPPKIKPPPGACCTQAHVFGPADKFPYSEGRGYTPPDAGIETYLNLLDILGLDRGVIVHGSAHGSDNRASLDGIARAPDRLRGIAVVDPEISDAALEELDAGGMRGIRLSTMLKGGVGSEQLAPMADKIRGLGWHIVLHVNDSKEIAELNSTLRNLPVPIVIDHLSRVRGGQGVDYVGFQALLRLMRETDHVWGKISSWYRLTDIGPPYDDMTPIARAMIAARPDRVIWGTNWPHPILWDHLMPNDGDLFNQFMDWAADDATRHQILVDNPAALYGFDP